MVDLRKQYIDNKVLLSMILHNIKHPTE